MKEIDYTNIVKAIFEGKLGSYIKSTKLSVPILALWLKCSESYINEMINGDIPNRKWVEHTGWKWIVAVNKVLGKEKIIKTNEEEEKKDLFIKYKTIVESKRKGKVYNCLICNELYVDNIDINEDGFIVCAKCSMGLAFGTKFNQIKDATKIPLEHMKLPSKIKREDKKIKEENEKWIKENKIPDFR